MKWAKRLAVLRVVIIQELSIIDGRFKEDFMKTIDLQIVSLFQIIPFGREPFDEPVLLCGRMPPQPLELSILQLWYS